MSPVANRWQRLQRFAPGGMGLALLLVGIFFHHQEALSQRAKPLVVTPLVEPWAFYQGDGSEHTGLLVNFQRELFARAGIVFDQKLKPYPRVIRDLTSGSADLGVMFRSAQAQDVGESLGAVVRMRIWLVVPADGPEWHTLAEFAGRRVGYVRGARYGSDFDDNRQLERAPVNTAEQGLRMLMGGRLDAMVFTEQSLFYAMHATGIESSQLKIALQLGVTSADFYVSRASLKAPWLPPLRAALEQMQADGSLTRIFSNHNYWSTERVCFAAGQCLTAEGELPVKPIREKTDV